MYVLGIDAGGTKTVCLLADEHAVVAEWRGPGSNLPAGVAGVTEAVLRDAVTAVLGNGSRRPAGICIGMAGVDRPHEAEQVREILSRLDDRAQILVVNDALIALEAGVPGGGAGVVLIAGTGSIAYGRDDAGHAARAGGWGAILGDEGSGYWLGRQALRAVMRAADRRGPQTRLAALILEHYQITHAHELVQHVYYGDLRPSAIAALSSLVQTAADAGDRVALDFIEVGGNDLAEIAESVARRLGLERCPVLLAGGVFQAVPRMRAAVANALRRIMPGAEPKALDVEPAEGAVRLAQALVTTGVRVPEYLP